MQIKSFIEILTQHTKSGVFGKIENQIVNTQTSPHQ